MSPTDREEFMTRIQRAYEEKGLRPRFRVFNIFPGYDGWETGADGTCCPLGALLVGTECQYDPLFGVDIWSSCERFLGWSQTEVAAFTRGADLPDTECYSALPDILAAYELGRMARRMLG